MSVDTARADHRTGLTPLRIVRSEWVKVTSLRSSWITLAVTVVFVIGLAAVFCAVTASQWQHAGIIDRATFDPTRTSLGGVFLAQLAIGVLGVLVVTGEYSSGQIRATFAAVPSRLPVLAAKVVVFAAIAVVVMVPSAIAGFEVGQLLLASQHIQTTLGAPSVTRAVIGGGLYLAVVGLFGLSTGWLIRHTAGAIATLFGLLLVAPLIVHFLPTRWSSDIGTWLPSNAGSAVLTVGSSPTTTLGPWQGFGVLCAWVAAFLLAAAVMLRRRDV